MSHLRAVPPTGAQLKADDARERLSMALHNMGLSEGQTSRLAALISSYGVASYEAGFARAEANQSPRGAA